jgi:hypothetical protein
VAFDERRQVPAFAGTTGVLREFSLIGNPQQILFKD